MLKLTGTKLVKFLYQHQDTKQFEHVKLKIKNHNKYSIFSIDEIYVFLLLYAPHAILNKTENHKLEKIFLDILSKSPKITNKNFKIPAHIPFLKVNKKKFKANKNINFLVILDQLGYYSKNSLFSTPPITNTVHNSYYTSPSGYYISNLHTRLYNKRNNTHKLLKGIKRIISEYTLYDSTKSPTILNILAPYSQALLRQHSHNIPFTSLIKRDHTLLKYKAHNFHSILYLANIKSSHKEFRKYIINNISSDSYFNMGNHMIDTYLLSESGKKTIQNLIDTPLTSILTESDILGSSYNHLNDFEAIYENFPKQTIINKNQTITEHIKSLKCIDYFFNIKTLVAMQEDRNNRLSAPHAFKFIEDNPMFDYFYDDPISIFEILSSYSNKNILELLRISKIKSAILDFFNNIDEYLKSSTKNIFLNNLVELCIQQNIWKPKYNQLIIIQEYLIQLINQDKVFVNTSISRLHNKLEFVETLLFELDLENHIPNHFHETKQPVILKY